MTSPGAPLGAGAELECHRNAGHVARQQQDAFGIVIVERVKGLEAVEQALDAAAGSPRLAAHAQFDDAGRDDFERELARADGLFWHAHCGDIARFGQPRIGLVADVADDADRLGRPGDAVADPGQDFGDFGWERAAPRRR